MFDMAVQQHMNYSGADARSFWNNSVYTMAAHALAPCIPRTSLAIVSYRIKCPLSLMILPNYYLNPLNHIHIWQVALQLCCIATCQIRTWYSIGNQCFHISANNGTRKIAWVTSMPIMQTELSRDFNIMTGSPGTLWHLSSHYRQKGHI